MEPLDHYRTYQEEYDQMWSRTTATGKVFEQARPDTRRDLLDQAVRFGLLSTQTKVPQQEQAYNASLEIGLATSLRDHIHDPNAKQLHSDQITPPVTFNTSGWRDNYGDPTYKRALEIWKKLANALRTAGVNYANNKAAYIVRNSVEPDYKSILNQWDNRKYDTVHRMIVDNFLGVGLAKGAYAMGKLGCSEKLCIDRHVADATGIMANNIYQGTVVERYEDQCERVETAFPDLAELPRPIFRWIIFDAHRHAEGEEPPVTRHDAWFASLPSDI